tara:strand:- start:849 stop:1913 length:1065 start_codon:yes stop_codon:yes gene_type:complete
MQAERFDMQEGGGEKILVIGPSWVGDMVMAQSLFMVLRKYNTDCRIIVVAPDWSLPLIDRMPEIEGHLEYGFKHGELNLARRMSVGKSIQAQNFSKTIVLPNSFKAALVPFHARIPVRIGCQGEFRRLLLTDCRKLDAARFPLMVQRFVALGLPRFDLPPVDIPFPRLITKGSQVSEALEQLDLAQSEMILAICPGAEFGGAKQWPEEHFARLCSVVIAKGWQVWIFGSANDTEVAKAIVGRIPEDKREACTDLTGRTSLAQAIDLMSVVTAVVSNDSGLMHIAAALQKPVVTLYGSSSPDFTPPLADRVKLIVNKIECSPCFKRKCPLGHLRCLTEISAERVLLALHELLEAE